MGQLFLMMMMKVPTGLNWLGVESMGLNIFDACVNHEFFKKMEFHQSEF